MSDAHGVGDNIRNTTETRLALLEETARRLEARVNVVSDRTHTLLSQATASGLMAEEARDQRIAMLTKVEAVETAISTLGRESLKASLDVAHHVATCSEHWRELKKIGIVLLGAMITAIGFLAAPYFHH